MATASLAVPSRAASAWRSASVTGVRVGDTVVADDGVVGSVDGVVSSEARTPVYVIVSVGRVLRRKYPVVPCSLVTAVDRPRRLVRIRGRRDAIRRMPETLPLVL